MVFLEKFKRLMLRQGINLGNNEDFLLELAEEFPPSICIRFLTMLWIEKSVRDITCYKLSQDKLSLQVPYCVEIVCKTKLYFYPKNELSKTVKVLRSNKTENLNVESLLVAKYFPRTAKFNVCDKWMLVKELTDSPSLARLPA